MASKVHSGNGTAVETEIPLPSAVETERTAEAEVKEAPEKEATPIADLPTVTEVAPVAETTIPKKNWPGSSGDCVFRVIVPMLKVESIFGRDGNGELINKMRQETKANIRVRKGPVSGPNLIVEISGKEDIEAPLSPAMDAVIRVFKLVNGFPENERSDGLAFNPFCSILLLIPLMQATIVIEKQGSPIRTMLENKGCYVASISRDIVSTLSANPDDRIVNLYGEGLTVLQALKAILGHLRKFLVAQMIQIPLVDAVDIMGVGGTNSGCMGGANFVVQKSNNSQQKISVEIRGTLSQVQAAQQLIQAMTGPGRAIFQQVRRVVDQVTQIMQIPLVDAVGIIGVEGTNFGCTSGAIFTVQESKVSRKRITVEIRGTTSQVQTAQQLIQAKTGPGRVSFGKVKLLVGQALTGPGLGPDSRGKKHHCSMLPPPHVAAGPLGEVTHKPQETGALVPPSAEISPPSAAAEAPMEPQTEPMVCSSLVEVPPELPQVQPASDLLRLNKDLPPHSHHCNSHCRHRHLSRQSTVTAPPSGEASLEPHTGGPLIPTSSETSPPLAAIETPVATQKEPMVCSSLVEVPLELPEVQPATTFMTVETKDELPPVLPEVQPPSELMAIDTEAEVPTELPQVQPAIESKAEVQTKLAEVQPASEPMAIETEAEVPAKLPQVQPAIETKAEVPTKLPEVKFASEPMAIETEVEVPTKLPLVQSAIETKAEVQTKLPEVLPASEPMAIETEAEVPAKLPQVQSAIETKPEVPTELPEVQPASSLEAIVPNAEEPVVPASTDDSTVVNGAMQMQVKKSVVRTGPGQVFSGRVQNYFGQRLAFPGPTRAITEQSSDRVHLHKDLPPPSHHGRRQPMSLPPHVIVIPSGMGSNKEPKRRVCWNINIVKTFLDACIHEVTINGWEDGSLKAMSWKNVMEILKDRHNFSVDRIQMKSYFDGLKSKYNAWVSLKSKTGNKYDPSTNTFNLSDKEWETQMKNKKIIGTLRNAPLPFPNLCAQLFGATISTGIKGCGPGSAKPIAETDIQKDSVSLVSPSSSNPPVKNEQKMGEASLEPQAAVPLVPLSAATETPVEAQKEHMVCSSLVEVPPELPQVQPATVCVAVESKAEVPTELPEVQPANALEAIETKPEEPVVPVSTDDSKVVGEPMEMQVEESIVLTGLDHDVFGPDPTAPGFFRTGTDQALSGPSLDRVHPYKDLPPPSHHCDTNSQSRRRTLSPPPQVAAAPSGMESVEESKRHRYHWNDNIVKTFLDACIHEIAIKGLEGGSLKAMSWKNVAEMLKDRHNFSIDNKQMKNYFDGLNSKYKAWVSLKHKTGNKYDPPTNMFNLTDKEWETEMMENKYIETLRNAPLPFPDLCAQLFDGATSTGSFQTRDDQALTGPEPGEIIDEPQATVPLIPPSAATEAPVEPQPQKELMVEVPPELPHVQPATAFMEIETEAEVPPVFAHVQPASELVPIETEQSMSVFEEEILGVLKVIADKMNKPEPPPKPTFEDCEKKLNELGWPKDDPLHLVALTIFCDENDNYRELWMKLNPNLCANWVRMIGRSKRFS